MEIGCMILKWIGMGCQITVASIVLIILINCLVEVVKSLTKKK